MADLLDQAFDPHAAEEGVYERWESHGWFAPTGTGTPYSIMLPPPNVTGSLHMGHAFQHTIMDALIRYQRMRGRDTLWQGGTDHAGIATQMIVERQLEQEQTDRHAVGREAFVERVWEWKARSGGEITRQLRRMGSSLDWSRERFTLDDGFSRAVAEVFVRLHDEGLIYRGNRLVNWDPELETAISDLEVENEEEAGHLWHFRYPLEDGRTTRDGAAWLVVATTRPETMLGDTAVAVHPDDERYADLVGARVRLPLADRSIPIIADDYVDPEFGTGCVKITPAHDFNDYEVGARHDLPRINVFTSKAAINDAAPAAYRGLDRFEARRQIVADLDALGLLERIDEHRLQVPRGDRSGAVVEPWLTDQWFVRIAPLAEPAIRAVENGDIRFVPRSYENLYFAWMREIRDWCISRQQWWGHRIPAWYDDAGNVYVARDEAEARARNGLGDTPLTRDPDVLETWFSSALWTFGTLGWPDATPELERYHPSSVLVTGHDIIFFWVARMIMMTLRFTGEIPFRDVYITGLVRDSEGRKMSKSKGNGLDPIDLIDGIDVDALVAKRTANLMQPQLAARIEKATRKEFPEGIPAYGTDALRFTFCALASTGREVRFDLARTAGYRNFCNKLWNATRFVLANAADPGTPATVAPDHGLAERWIRSRLDRLVRDVALAFETYRFDLLATHLYDFIWHEYCDWYLEIAKPVLWDESTPDARRAAVRATLLEVLEQVLRIAHPVIPFITEVLWQRVAPRLGIDGASIMTQPMPVPDEARVDSGAEAGIDWLKAVVGALRNIRGEMDIAPSRTLTVLLAGGTPDDRRRLADTESIVARLAKVDSFRWLDEGTEPPPAAMQLVGDLRVLVPLAGLIDVDAERARLGREIERRRQDVGRVSAKLGNEKFVARAPADVVDKEREKLREAESALAELTRQLEAIASLER